MNSDQALDVTDMKEAAELEKFNERYTDAVVFFEEFEGILLILVGKEEGAPHFSVGHDEGVEGPGGVLAMSSDDWQAYSKVTRRRTESGLDWGLQQEYLVYLRVYEKYGRQVVVPQFESWYKRTPGPITPEIEARRRREAVLAVEARLRGETVPLVPPGQNEREAAWAERARLSDVLSDYAVYARVYAELYPASPEDKLVQTKIAELNTKIEQVKASIEGIRQARESRWAALSQTKVTKQ